MKSITRKSFISILVILAVIDVTYSSDNETSTEGRRQARVSGRIVKLYSGAKHDPILCLGDGFQADPVDCSVFYRCLKASNGKYTVYRFQCGPGTVYDPDTEVCNHPRSTKRLECGGNSVGLITSTDKYIENEINELHKENQELPLPITTKFPIYSNPNAINDKTSSHATTSEPDKFESESSYITTSHPWVTTSKPYYETTLISTAYPWKITTNYQTSNIYVTNQPTIQSKPQSSSREDNQCTSDGFMGDNKDCRKFYRCVSNQRGGFIRYEFSCSELTIWDDDTQGCNHPWAVQRSRCGKSYDENSIGYLQDIKNNEVSPPRTTQHQTQLSYGSKVTQSQTQISKGPVNQNQTQINYGHMTNQEKHDVKQDQIQISSGSAVSQTQTQINYGNKVTQTQLQVDHSVESSQTQTQISELDTPSTSVQSTTKSNEYAGSKCTKNGFMGDLNDCKKFYRCISNGRGAFARQDFFCSEGTLWDEKLEACNHAWAVKDCGARILSQNNAHTTTSVSNATNGYYTTTLSTINHDVSDVGYGNKNDYHKIEQPISTTQTTSVTSETTKPTKLLDTECKSSGFYGNVNDCAKFYRCVEGSGRTFTKYEYKCGDGTFWDAEIESCNHAWAVKCNNALNQETVPIPSTEPSTVNSIITTVFLIQTTTQKNIQMNDYDTGYGFQQPQTTQVPTTSVKPVNQGNECKSSGFMGDNYDCKKFYRCEEDGRGKYIRHEFTCGEGTVWDSKIQACNHAWAVETCGGNAIEDNSNSQVPTSRPASPVYESDVDNSYTTQNYKNTENPSKISTSTETPHYSPSEVKENECQANGFMGNKNDCKIFYRCVENGKGDYTRYEFSCGEGTLWDPKIEACNHAWAVEKCGETIPANENVSDSNTSTKSPINNESTVNEKVTETSTQYTTTILISPMNVTSTVSSETNKCTGNGFLGDKYDCKKFYRCVDDGKGNFLRYEFSCGDGTVWDSKIDACNHAWAVETCGVNSLPTKHEETTAHLNTINDEQLDNNYPTPNYEVTSSTTLKPITTDSNQCKTDGFMGDKNDCKRFYRCVNDGKGTYMRYEFSCGDGTVWNSDINACNHIYSVKNPCGTSSVQTTEESTANNTPENPYSESNGSTSTTINPPVASNDPQCKQEGFIGDINDCKKFYRCTGNGEGGFNKYEFTCGEGTAWDQEILACNHASSDQHCNTVSTESHPESTSSSSPTKTSTVITQTTQKTDTAFNKDQCSSEGFYANSEDCKKFYRCVNNGKGGFNKYDFSCGDGTVWVQEIQACDHDSDNSYCKTGVVSTTPSNSNHEQTQASTMPSSIKTTEKSTPSRESDEYNSEQTSKPTSISENDCSSEGYYPNKNNCKEFFRCVSDGHGGYLKYEFVCSEGTAWDTNTQSCNYISEVNDCQSTNQTGIQTKPTEQDEQVSESNSTSTTESSSSTTTATATSQDNCQEAGYFGNSQDCSKFYRCVDNGNGGFTKYDFSCGDGTIWDQDITACNHPQDVTNPSCNNSGSTPTSTTTINNNESSEMTTTKTTTTTTAPTSTSSGDSSTQKTSTEKSTAETTSTKPNNNNYTCTKAGFYADPYDCKKFYRCVDWDGEGKRFSIYHFDCGDGTIWDPELETCNHEDSVYPPRECNGAQPQNENNTTTTTTEGSKQEETTKSSTTQEASTSAESTTQKSTTQSSTTESSTASTTEQTTTQQSPASEQTTSTEKSTTQQSTTQQSTTQQSTTTSDQTSSQQSTTEQSTTQQSTTASDQTTSQQTSTEQSTTQQSTTTSDQTTSQQSTTEASTSTSTTTEQTTSTSTEQSTTSTEQSTTSTEQSTTTTEQTTSTTEQTTTTTGSTTSEDTTTSAQSTTSESTTASSTEGTTKADETTTQESTTEQQTSETQSSSTEQSTTSQEQTEASSTTESGQESTTSSDKECPETDDDQYLYVCPTGFRRHPKYCNLFYQCTEDEDTHEVKVAVFNCPNNTIYDESQIQCVEEEKADKKCDGEIAQKRRFKRLDANHKEPIIVNKEKYSCPSTGHFPFEKNEECSPVLYKCEVTKTGKLRGFVYQCPKGYVYWSISRRCEPVNAMTDCKHSYSNWTGRYEIPTERKNVSRKKY